MTLVFWLTLAVLLLLHAGILKMLVPIVARGTDNGWDNALAYVVVTALLFAFPFRWMITSGSIGLAFLAPPLCWIAQTAALKTLYELRPFRAWVIGVAHAVLVSALTIFLAVAAGAIAAYILYGKIINDPLLLIRLILRLIGIEPPF